MHKAWLVCIVVALSLGCAAPQKTEPLNYFKPNDPNIQYTGRIDFTNPEIPRFWQPGVYFTVRFTGPECRIVLNDEMLWGNKHNYIELVLDGKQQRLQTKARTDTILVGSGLGDGIHELTVSKNTEANIGYFELVAIGCNKIEKPGAPPSRKMEFIGNSITCGTGSDESLVPCGQGLWEDQHNAYLSYGALTARALNASYHLSAVSGIGLMHSCCNLGIIMPQVFDKISMRENRIAWDFNRYQPDVLTISLGQNDGIQDSAEFCNNYVDFIKQIRKYYPNTTIVCLTSPMADESLASFMRLTLGSIVNTLNRKGDDKVYNYFFSKQYQMGCDGHPSLAEHEQIAAELISFVKKTMHW